MSQLNGTEKSSSPLLLLVQNNARVAVVKALQELGYRVAIAKSVNEAREMLDDLQFIESDVDGLVVDYRLPDGLGSRIVQDFRHDNPHVPAALILDEDDIAMQVWSAAKGVALLQKPYLWSQLQPWLERLTVAA